MTDAGFFKGTNTDQDSRFADKKKKLLKSMKFGDNLNEKVDTQRVNVESIKPWIVKRITELLSYEDDIICDFVVNMLSEQFPDPKDIQITLTAFLGSKSARVFVTELWDLLLSAMNTAGGVPAIFLEAKKAEILSSKTQEEKFRSEQATRQLETGSGSGGIVNRPKEHGDGPSPPNTTPPSGVSQRHRSPPSQHERRESDSRIRHSRRYSSSPDSERGRSRSQRRRRDEEETEAEAAEHSDWDRRRRHHRRSRSRSPSGRRQDYHRRHHHYRRRGHSPRDRRYDEMDTEADIRLSHDRQRYRLQSREGRRSKGEAKERGVHSADGPICVPRVVTPSPPPARRQQSPVAEARPNGSRHDIEAEDNIGRSHHTDGRSLPREERPRRREELYREEVRSYKETSSWRQGDSGNRRSRPTAENETYIEERRRDDNYEEEDRSRSRQRWREDEKEETEHRRHIPSSSRRRSPEGPTPPPVEKCGKKERREREEDVPVVSPEGPELPTSLVKSKAEEKTKVKKKVQKRRSSPSSSSTSSSSSSDSSSDDDDDDDSSDSSSSYSDSTSSDSDSDDSSSSTEDSDVRSKDRNLKNRKFNAKKEKAMKKKKGKMHKHKAKEKSMKKKRKMQVKDNLKKDKKKSQPLLSPEGPELPPPVESPGVEWKEKGQVEDSTSSSSNCDSSTESSSISSSSSTSSNTGERREKAKKSLLKRTCHDGAVVEGGKERGRRRQSDAEVSETPRSSAKRRRHTDDTDALGTGEGQEDNETHGYRGSSRQSEEDRLRRKALESLKRKNAVAEASNQSDSA